MSPPPTPAGACFFRRNVLWVALFAMAPLGCSGLHPVDPPVAESARLPGWAELGRAVTNAALHPATWAPALGAAAFTIDHFDRRAVSWASTHTPVFGSQRTANDVSTALDVVLGAGTVASELGAPSPAGSSPWEGRAQRAGVDLLAGGLAEGAAIALKEGVGRTRPNGEGHSSFPAGHSTFAFSMAATTSRNLDATDIPDGWRTALDAASYLTGATVGYARVEAKEHFPSDSLAGAAIGNFLGILIHDAFFAQQGAPPLELAVQPARHGVELGLTWRH